ncbi:three component ABC system middle component [Vibrio parahaemolyticus]|nr:hypothetical protein [Vibrio parahaemolyticus]
MIYDDVFVETNPAYCALILHGYIQGFQSESSQGVEFPLAFLALPISMSSNYDSSFKNTRVDTGFFTWVDRNPNIIIELVDLISDTKKITKSAIKFGAAKRIIGINSLGRLISDGENIIPPKKVATSSELGRIITKSYRFGQWLGQVNSTSTIYNHLGLEI